MKKKLLLVLCFSFLLVGCGGDSPINVNVDNSDELSNDVLGLDALIEIGSGLYYDSSTRIVYWWNGYFYTSQAATVPTVYYAPNGLPYKYNPETNTFEEIESE